MNTQISQKGGQVLLIVIMVVATLLTVVLSLVFKSQTETQITHLEEQNQKALAAAEAAIDTALKQQSNISFGSNSNFLTNFQGYTGQATLSTNIKNTFVSPLLHPDEQYTNYLVTYDPAQYATQYAKYGEAPASMYSVPAGLLRDKDGQLVKLDGDISRFVGMETIRPGELDNAVNGLKEQLGSAFDANWNQRYAPKLANLPEARRNEIYQKTRDQFWNTLDWSDYIKYDPLVGMYTNMGAVKHVNDQKFDLLNDRVAPIAQAVMAAVVTGPMAAQAGAAAGS